MSEYVVRYEVATRRVRQLSAPSEVAGRIEPRPFTQPPGSGEADARIPFGPLPGPVPVLRLQASLTALEPDPVLVAAREAQREESARRVAELTSNEVTSLTLALVEARMAVIADVTGLKVLLTQLVRYVIAKG